VACEGGDAPITVRADGEVDLKYGDKVFLTPDTAQIHKFDSRGLRID